MLPCPDGPAVEVLVRLEDYTAPVRALAFGRVGLGRVRRVEQGGEGRGGVGVEAGVAEEGPVEGRRAGVPRWARMNDERDVLRSARRSEALVGAREGRW